MLANVRVMYQDGRRVHRERLKIMQPERGDLLVTRRRDSWRNTWVPVAVLNGSDDTNQLPALDQVSIAKWSGLRVVAKTLAPHTPDGGSAHSSYGTPPICRRARNEPP